MNHSTSPIHAGHTAPAPLAPAVRLDWTPAGIVPGPASRPVPADAIASFLLKEATPQLAAAVLADLLSHVESRPDAIAADAPPVPAPSAWDDATPAETDDAHRAAVRFAREAARASDGGGELAFANRLARLLQAGSSRPGFIICPFTGSIYSDPLEAAMAWYSDHAPALLDFREFADRDDRLLAQCQPEPAGRRVFLGIDPWPRLLASAGRETAETLATLRGEATRKANKATAGGDTDDAHRWNLIAWMAGQLLTIIGDGNAPLALAAVGMLPLDFLHSPHRVSVHRLQDAHGHLSNVLGLGQAHRLRGAAA